MRCSMRESLYHLPPISRDRWPCLRPTYFRWCLIDFFIVRCIIPRTPWANMITVTPGIRAPKPNPDRSTVPLGEPIVISIPMEFFSRCITSLIIMDSGSWQLICPKPNDDDVENVPRDVKAFVFEKKAMLCVRDVKILILVISITVFFHTEL